MHEKKSPLDPAEIRDPVDRIAETAEQRKAACAFVSLWGVNDHLFKEPVDGSAQGGKRSHRIAKPLVRHRLRSARGSGIERVDQRLFGRFGLVGKLLSPFP